METKTALISGLIKEAFLLSKLRHDLFEFLNWDKSFESADGYRVPVYNESTTLIDYVTINENDEIKVVVYKYVHHHEDVYYSVIIGIGTFIEHEVRDFFTVSKCLGTLKYNHDFSCYDIEFSISDLNRQR